MKKLDNFINCLTILANADFKMAETNDIYRTGVIGQFNLTFELAWKALQEIMRKYATALFLRLQLLKIHLQGSWMKQRVTGSKKYIV